MTKRTSTDKQKWMLTPSWIYSSYLCLQDVCSSVVSITNLLTVYRLDLRLHHALWISLRRTSRGKHFSVLNKHRRKPTDMDHYLDFTSHHPTSAKRSVVQPLFNRLEYVTLNKKARLREKEAIKDDLVANDYPLYMYVKRKEKQQTELVARLIFRINSSVAFSYKLHFLFSIT